jgi:hypothetical protein
MQLDYHLHVGICMSIIPTVSMETLYLIQQKKNWHEIAMSDVRLGWQGNH